MTPTKFKGIRRIDTIAHYETLVSTGSVVISGVTVTYDPDYLYIVDERDYYLKTETNELVTALTGNTAPTTATKAAYVGQIYVNTTNNFIYVCTAITTSENVTTYTWMSPSPLTFTDVIVEES